MHIESIKLKNFKSFKNAEMVDLPKFCVIVGANGVGKTTLFDVFGFLKDCLTYNVKKALQTRGGFENIRSRGCVEDDNIEIEIKFKMYISGIERLVTYITHIGLDKKKPVVKREILRYKRGRYGSPYHFLDFSTGTGYAITNEEDFDKPDEELAREEQSIEKEVLAIKGLGQFERFKGANAFKRLIESWHVPDFHGNFYLGSTDSIDDHKHISTTGDNWRLVARNLYENHIELFQKIVESMKHRVPGLAEIEPILTEDGRLILNFKDDAFEDPFIDKYVSDGTIKMFVSLLLLYDPEPHPLLCVEEPENQLYPDLLHELAEEFRAYSEKGGQVFVSSHSPDFLNAVRIDEVYWLFKEKGYTSIKRAKDDNQLVAFMKAGDQMGYLWKEGFFKDAAPQ